MNGTAQPMHFFTQSDPMQNLNFTGKDFPLVNADPGEKAYIFNKAYINSKLRKDTLQYFH